MGIAPTERFLLRRQVAAAVAARKESVSSSLFMEINMLEVEEDLSTVATALWGRWCAEKKEVRGVILAHQEKSGLPEKLHK